ncbi:PqqD family protein [Ruegeria atlantica]|uniref:PqqD family protein n=1 Tax=Ruegeria atlantica TaxID=81569 RepID=UPI0024954B4F|nr:PqqD family protein [Ruegeria atlantica]
MTITAESVITMGRTLVTTKVGDETVIFDDESGIYIGLNEVGTAILEELDGPKSVALLVDALMSTYDVDQDTCQKNIISFLDDMLEAKLISIKAA